MNQSFFLSLFKSSDGWNEMLIRNYIMLLSLLFPTSKNCKLPSCAPFNHIDVDVRVNSCLLAYLDNFKAR